MPGKPRAPHEARVVERAWRPPWVEFVILYPSLSFPILPLRRFRLSINTASGVVKSTLIYEPFVSLTEVTTDTLKAVLRDEDLAFIAACMMGIEPPTPPPPRESRT